MPLFRRKSSDSDIPDIPRASSAESERVPSAAPALDEVRTTLRLAVLPAESAPRGSKPLVTPLVADLAAAVRMGVDGPFVGPDDLRRWGADPYEVVAIAQHNLRREPVRLEPQEAPFAVYAVTGVDSPADHLTRLHELLAYPPDGVLVYAPLPSLMLVHPITGAAFISLVSALARDRRKVEGTAPDARLLTRSLIWCADHDVAYPVKAELTEPLDGGNAKLDIRVPPAFEPIYQRMLAELPRTRQEG